MGGKWAPKCLQFRGVWGMPPRKCLNFRSSEIAFYGGGGGGGGGQKRF